ncbi:MAG: hypothetical protein ABIS14_05330, partial [Sphingomonas sp.]
MKTRIALMIGLSATAFGVVTVGTLHGAAAVAGARDESHDEKAALADARQAQTLIAGGQAEAAVTYAEKAVELRPRTSDYRIVLGQAYLKSG